MSKKIDFDNLPNEQDIFLTSDDCCLDDFCLTDRDFYPPCDDRVWKSNVEDIDDGDNFADYCEYIYAILDEEDYYEN